MSRPDRPFTLGAVAYDAKVVTIWDGFLRFFEDRGLPFDYVLYTNYESQVEAHFAGHLDVAWNSPLAWVETERVCAQRGRRAEAIAMRDSDQDLTSVILTRAGSGISTSADLRGKVVAVGAGDSPQATLIPLLHLADESGLTPHEEFEVQRHDLLVGKHGDHIGGERDAVKALLAGKADAACILDANHLAFTREGTLAAGQTEVLTQTPAFDHCNFTVLDDAPDEQVARFKELLLAMSYDDPEVRPLLDLEGLKQWREGRVSGYAQLEQAVDRFGYLDAWLARMAG
jgi:ABC-type phosphate/phosphonate transport system substrate-binding protein